MKNVEKKMLKAVKAAAKSRQLIRRFLVASFFITSRRDRRSDERCMEVQTNGKVKRRYRRELSSSYISRNMMNQNV